MDAVDIAEVAGRSSPAPSAPCRRRSTRSTGPEAITFDEVARDDHGRQRNARHICGH